MKRRSSTTGLNVEASYVINNTMDMLSNPDCGTDMRAVGTYNRRVAL